MPLQGAKKLKGGGFFYINKKKKKKKSQVTMPKKGSAYKFSLSLQGGSRYVMIGSSQPNKGGAERCFTEVA